METRDVKVLKEWIRDHPLNTQRSYTADFMTLKKVIPIALPQLSVRDLGNFQESVKTQPLPKKARLLASIKSLLSFAFSIGYIQDDLSASIILPHAISRVFVAPFTVQQTL